MSLPEASKVTIETFKFQFRSNYRELLRLIARLPAKEQPEAFKEARNTVRSRKNEEDPQKKLDYFKELASKIGYLRMVTPRRPRDSERGSGRYVIRDGKLVEGDGGSKGSRVADGSISMNEAQERNRRDFKRFFGKDKPSNVFF
mmetsp:Transcript_7369/g.14510  ORF Transcript_7369/g.14510 Transcript_7369/m.14510 type:complete len:144 (-) Transcript_7369:79-510(-)|eukprot:CAMPEP_0175063222 /NCGR_PEP_ID=MMETSP0052_2-20121109/14628_1 /TAXON_ID=51329 ORGANISM="Polytomella parva, Strain SAG 63-3" /NCGR_SAMPLE_ID=MMETSP0052_2 /ASSEMBLY_ACC=CAM_ASM_000194 /LENGTH=143 /DNA_ID=CAMNT_0016329379 /DNA_START=151 /DNA_END=582 /DNA_ORIENTATION=-